MTYHGSFVPTVIYHLYQYIICRYTGN
eukprot:UN21416